VQAILDYSGVSERWNAPARYYSMEYPVGRKQKALFVFIDTAPLIDKYRKDEGDEDGKYSDAGEQSIERQLYWLDSTLVASNGRWKIVIGHHPVYADTDKEASERTDMQERVGTILENRKADFYISGHIHNFQYIKPEGKTVNYIVNSSASQSRKVKPIEGTVFCNGDPGYSVFSVSRDSVRFSFVNHTGETVYRGAVGKK
jgi:predicted phosphodiesterase